MLKLIISILILINSALACDFSEKQMEFYINHVSSQNIDFNGKRIFNFPKYKNCPTKITELFINNKIFVKNLITEFKKEYIVSEHILEHILRPKEQIFPPILLIKEN